MAVRWRSEWRWGVWLGGGFLLAYYLPVERLAALAPGAFPLWEALALVRWYAREHMILCLVPAFFIAGAISVFVSQGAVLRYLGAGARRVVAYGVAAVSGTLLAVCSCTVLPLFAGIYKRGAGLGPATTFLYSGPAINVLAIILTARVLGLELGVARAVGAIGFSVVLGIAMQIAFQREERGRTAAALPVSEGVTGRPAWQGALLVASLVGILVFANWGGAGAGGVFGRIASAKWIVTGGFAVGLAAVLVAWYGAPLASMLAASVPAVALAGGVPSSPAVPFAAGAVGVSAVASTRSGELGDWFDATWGFVKQIVPLLLVGVLVAGLLLGRPGHAGLLPARWIETAVGGNSIAANLFAAVAGALMYFATLTEVPILQGLLGAGMGNGPALALLLAGPAVSLPSLLVIRSVLGTKKTLAFAGFVIVLSAIAGAIYGAMTG